MGRGEDPSKLTEKLDDAAPPLGFLELNVRRRTRVDGRLHDLVRLEGRVGGALRRVGLGRRRRERVDLPVERRRLTPVCIAGDAVVRLVALVALGRVRRGEREPREIQVQCAHRCGGELAGLLVRVGAGCSVGIDYEGLACDPASPRRLSRRMRPVETGVAMRRNDGDGGSWDYGVQVVRGTEARTTALRTRATSCTRKRRRSDVEEVNFSPKAQRSTPDTRSRARSSFEGSPDGCNAATALYFTTSNERRARQSHPASLPSRASLASPLSEQLKIAGSTAKSLD